MRPWLVLVLLLMSLRGWGQGILWERSYSWTLPDELNDVVEADSGNFIVAGERASYGFRFGGTVTTYAASLMKINAFGDSLWTRNYGYAYPGQPHLCRADSGSVYLFSSFQISTDSFPLRLLKINADGEVLWQQPVPGLGRGLAIVTHLARASDGSLIASGFVNALSGTGNTRDMFACRMEPSLGLTYFVKRFSDNPYTTGDWIEETPRHTYLVSGVAGSRIWAVEIDSNGTEIQRQTMYQTPTRAVFNQYSTVKQAPGGRFIVSGGPLNFSPNFSYFGSYAGFSSSSRLWGGEQYGSCLPPYVQDDGSVAIFWNRATVNYLTKVDGDSTRIWDQRAQSQLGTNQPGILAFSYLSDSSVVAVGSIYFPGTAKTDFYLCRISGVGVPYDPAQPVANKPRYKGLPPLIAYPNPSSGRVTIHTRGRQPLAVYSLSGQKRLEVQADASGTTVLDLSGLPKGMYMLRQGENAIKLIKD